MTEENQRERRKQRTSDLFAKKPNKNEDYRRGDRPINLVSNLLQMRFNPGEKTARQYSIKIFPELANDNYALRRKILKQISDDLSGYYNPYIPAGYTLFSSSKETDQQVTFNTEVEIDKEHKESYKITIEQTKNIIRLDDIRAVDDETIKVKSLIEILIKNIIGANDGLVRFDDRSFFDFVNINRLRGNGKAYLMPGFSTAAVITEMGLYLRVNDKNKFISGKTAKEKLNELHSEYKNGSFLQAAEEFFVGKSVLAKYGSYRVYRITGITVDKTVENTTLVFADKDGRDRNESLYNYYKIQYGIEIEDKSQPLLIHQPDVEGLNAIYLIPELCYLTGMDEDMRESTDFRREMISRTKMDANGKMKKIESIMGLLKNQKRSESRHRITKRRINDRAPDEIRKDWGLEFKDFCEVQGRILAPPDIIFRDKTVKIERGRFRCAQVISPMSFRRENWVCISSRDSREAATSMVRSLIKASNNIGIKVEEPEYIGISGRNCEDFIEDLKKHSEIRNMKIVFFVVDRHTKHYYSSIKDYLYNTVGIPCQCASSDKKSQNLSYFTNVLVQMNVKMGGELYKIHVNNNLESRVTMIIGLDSSKIQKGSTKFVMTSSINPCFSKYFTQQQICKNEEKAATIKMMIEKALNKFKEIGAPRLPEMVIVYRQGGNDKQKERLFNDEVPVFKEMIEGSQGPYPENSKGKLCYISVNKKTDLKFFQAERGRHLNNPESGMVVDSGAVSPNFYEFYLQPQYVNQGTATPVHYHCLYESIGIPLEILEKVTYNQTYYYWNWPGPIREPAALKFAEVCNGFTTKYFKNAKFVNENLLSTPFYI